MHLEVRLKGHAITLPGSQRPRMTVVNVGRIGPTGPQGPQGPVGPPGAAGSTHVHTQAIASDTWVVNHNLGFRPDVAVFSPGGLEVETEVAHITANQTEIRFVSPQTGTARLT